MNAHTPEEISKQFDEITSVEVMRQLRIFNAASEMFELLKKFDRLNKMGYDIPELTKLIQKIEGDK